MATDPEVVKAVSTMSWTITKVAVPIIIVGGIIGFILLFIRLKIERKFDQFLFKRRQKKFSNTIEKCQICQGNLIQRHGKNGTFIGCTNYPICKYTRNI